jgi:putative glutamine amidotransferase
METVNRVYVDAVVAAGGVPIVLPVLDASLVPTLLESIDGLILSGGGDISPRFYGQEPAPELDVVDEGRDVFELALVHEALERHLPVLGVCRGHQLVNVALGGTLIQHVGSLSDVAHQEKERPSDVMHEVHITAGSLLAAVVGTETLGVNTLHHQAVSESGAGLQVVARSTDGLVEGVEGVGDLRVLGVQWHPELLQARPGHLDLFRWVVTEAARPARTSLELTVSPPTTRPTRPSRAARRAVA